MISLHSLARPARLAGFTLTLGILLYLLNGVLTPKWTTGVYHNTYTVTGFYALPRDQTDVLFLGSSHIEVAISPLSLWQAHGISSYSLSTARQSPLIAYYYLREALKYQQIRVVVIEANLLYRQENIDIHEDSYRSTLDHIRLSPLKLEAAVDVASYSQTQDVIGYLLPLLRYHSRWSELEASDFRLSLIPDHSYRGYIPIWNSVDVGRPPENIPPETQTTGFTTFGEDYMNRIAALCKQKGIHLILVQPTDTLWNNVRSKEIQAWADSWQVPFVDYNANENLAAIQLDTARDFFESSHLNAYGAEKLTAHFGAYLAAHYSLADHRGSPAFTAWDKDYAYYAELLER